MEALLQKLLGKDFPIFDSRGQVTERARKALQKHVEMLKEKYCCSILKLPDSSKKGLNRHMQNVQFGKKLYQKYRHRVLEPLKSNPDRKTAIDKHKLRISYLRDSERNSRDVVQTIVNFYSLDREYVSLFLPKLRLKRREGKHLKASQREEKVEEQNSMRRRVSIILDECQSLVGRTKCRSVPNLYI